MRENRGMVMARHWYSSVPVVDGLPLLGEPGFWAAHLVDLYEGEPPEAFGVDAGDAGAMLDRLQDKSAWPMFTVPLEGGFSIVVHYNSGEEYTTTDYFLVSPGGADVVLASPDEDRIGPGLCWPELVAILRAPDGADGVTDPHARLLLLLPALGDSRVPEEAVGAVVEALIANGAPDECEALARQLLAGHPMWGAQPWSFDTDERSWICDSELSHRQSPLGDHLPPAERAALADCLNPGTVTGA
ncbi:hypothetical protein E6W39_03960 [Kitasatospora acidiphila]|uniref:Uncharacterized protein n=1 Tax=Kitasatospora acidiphila TaxID=2567942 RepID=A0A540VXS1_9ACTN|nr:hypothetical protein [Kitasatospora acidiphila]TQF01552.1 hypothetical protein E6W39_03960 [Kitasatospora acidiphila]